MSRSDLPSGHQSVSLEVEGMKCGGCVRSVEQILLEQPNVANASVNLVTRTAWLDLQASDQSLQPILAALAARGFSARPRDTTPLKESTASAGDSLGVWWHQWRQLMVALVLLLLSVLGHLDEGGHLQLPILGELPFHAIASTDAAKGL